VAGQERAETLLYPLRTELKLRETVR
jgi:hypothetical protein